MLIPFLKMQGLGNDFVVIDDLGKPAGLHHPVTPELARSLCDRRFGVGCDQLLWLRAAQDPRAHARMEILNPDGSYAEMCGNGIRAVGLYLHAHGPDPRRAEYDVETAAGTLRIEITADGAAVDMGRPRLSSMEEELKVDGRTLRFREVSMGNPHAVFLVDDVDAVPLEKLGAEIERHPRFPERTNVEFVQVTGPSELRVRVWERGAGVTLACGTGACASAVAALAAGQVSGPDVRVSLPGGALKIRWSGDSSSPVRMEGPAEEVFRGEFLV